MTGEQFRIERQPTREFDRDGQGTLVGSVRFELHPVDEAVDVADAVEAILADERYTAGAWFDLPQPVYLVRDAALGSVFRVVVGPGTVGLDVLPTTEAAALAAFHRRLVARTGTAWSVERESPVSGGTE